MFICLVLLAFYSDKKNMNTKNTVKNTNCCVYGCSSKKSRNPEIHFHYFPSKNQKVHITNKRGIIEEVDRRKVWENILLMGKPVTKHMRVCSLHFSPEDYRMKTGTLHMKISPRLGKNAVPSQNLPKKTIQVKTSNSIICSRHNRLVRRQQLREQQPIPSTSSSVPEEMCTDEMSAQTLDLTEQEQEAVDGLLQLFQTRDPSETTKCDKSLQVCSGDFKIEFWQTIKSDSMLNSVSGVQNFKLFRVLCKLVDELYPRKRHTLLSTADSVLLVFMKLKLGIKFKVISFFFNVSPSLCSKIFQEFIQILSKILKSFLVWPSLEECRKNIPSCFRDFQNVRVIIDCTEIPINQPKCLCCRVKTYSYYKKRNTIKVMTGVSPAGLLTYVSKAYGGRTSDKVIFEESGIINKLEPHLDAIMVDKGFLVEEICNQHFIRMIRPTFLRNKKQFNQEESRHNRKISRARVHVERVNQRLRLFDILNSPMSWSLVRHIDDIIMVCSGMVNLQKPLFSDDKF